MLRPLCAIVALNCLILPVAAAGIVLEQKYPEGTTFVMQLDEKQSFKFTPCGTDVETTATAFTVTTTTIGHRASDGTLKIEEKANSLQSETTIPGGVTQRFDSIDPLKKAEMPELELLLESLRALCLPLTIELDAHNKINQVSLPQGEFEKLSESSQVQFKPESLKKTAERARDYLPDMAVNKGESWERSSEVHLGSGHVLTFLTRYQYDGTIQQDGKTLHKITGKSSTVGYTVDQKSSVPMTVEDTKVTDSEQIYLFDQELGALISRTSKVQITAKMTIDVDNQRFDGTFNLTLEEKTNRQK